MKPTLEQLETRINPGRVLDWNPTIAGNSFSDGRNWTEGGVAQAQNAGPDNTDDIQFPSGSNNCNLSGNAAVRKIYADSGYTGTFTIDGDLTTGISSSFYGGNVVIQDATDDLFLNGVNNVWEDGADFYGAGKLHVEDTMTFTGDGGNVTDCGVRVVVAGSLNLNGYGTIHFLDDGYLQVETFATLNVNVTGGQTLHLNADSGNTEHHDLFHLAKSGSGTLDVSQAIVHDGGGFNLSAGLLKARKSVTQLGGATTFAGGSAEFQGGYDSIAGTVNFYASTAIEGDMEFETTIVKIDSENYDVVIDGDLDFKDDADLFIKQAASAWSTITVSGTVTIDSDASLYVESPTLTGSRDFLIGDTISGAFGTVYYHWVNPTTTLPFSYLTGSTAHSIMWPNDPGGGGS